MHRYSCDRADVRVPHPGLKLLSSSSIPPAQEMLSPAAVILRCRCPALSYDRLRPLLIKRLPQGPQEAKERALARTRTWDLSHLMSFDSPKRES